MSAACRRADIALEAKAPGRTCPVQASCLAESLDGPTALPGVWGGAGPSDRKKLRKARVRRTAAWRLRRLQRSGTSPDRPSITSS